MNKTSLILIIACGLMGLSACSRLYSPYKPLHKDSRSTFKEKVKTVFIGCISYDKSKTVFSSNEFFTYKDSAVYRIIHSSSYPHTKVDKEQNKRLYYFAFQHPDPVGQIDSAFLYKGERPTNNPSPLSLILFPYKSKSMKVSIPFSGQKEKINYIGELYIDLENDTTYILQNRERDIPYLKSVFYKFDWNNYVKE